MFRLYLYARVRFLRTVHTRPRVQHAPGIPYSLVRGKGLRKTSGTSRRENAKLYQ